MAFTCTDTLSSASDLNNIYFKDVNGRSYFLPITTGRQALKSTVTSCANIQATGRLSDMKLVSIPPNAYAYFYQNSSSISPSLQLAGEYYSANISSASTTPAFGVFQGEKIIDFFQTDNTTYAINCQCASGGTTASGCGALYGQGLTPDVCSQYANTIPPTTIPPPTSFEPDVKRGYSTVFWIVFGITCLVLVLAIIVMILMLSGALSFKPSIKPPQLNTAYYDPNTNPYTFRAEM